MQQKVTNHSFELSDNARMRMELEAMQHANAALEQQLLSDAEYTAKMLRVLESQKDELGDANQRLRSQADFIQRVMDTTSSLMIVLDPEGRLRRINRQSTESLDGKNIAINESVLDDWLHPDEQQKLADSLPELPWKVHSPFFETVRMYGSYTAEHRLREHNGGYRFYLVKASMLYNPQGKREGAVVSATDITQIKEQQTLLKRSEKLLKEAQTIAQLGHWELDITSEKMTCSEEVYRILERDSSLSPPSMEEFLNLIHPDDLVFVKDNLISLPASAEPRNIEYRIQFKDGRVKWIQNRFVTYFDHPESINGKAVRIIGTLQDITSRHQADEQLKLAACVFDNSLNGIMITDAHSNIIKVNRIFCDITGYSPEEVYGQKPSILHSGRQDESFYKRLWSDLSRKGNWQGEIYNKRKNGEVYQQFLSISAIYDNDNTVVQYVGVFADISEQRQLEEQLRQSQKLEAIGTLVGGIAHDFNNTLAAIRASLYLARMYNKGNTDVATRLDDIDRLSEHSAQIIQQLLTFARKGIVKMEPVILNVLFLHQKRITESFMPENIEFEIDVCEERLTVEGDMPQLQQVMLNLFNNARDAVDSCDKPRIECVLRQFIASEQFLQNHPELSTPDLAHIMVRDNGKGILEHDLPHVFEPFFTTKEVGTGSGLGMSMVYGSVQTHGGVIDIESTPGQGTTVHVYLPLIENKENEKPAQEFRKDHVEKEFTVLLIDDNDDVRTMFAEALKVNGYEVLTATNGSEALSCYEEKSFAIDLVISDIVMPKMGGIDAVAKMRIKRPELPVIFITGYDPETNVPMDLRDRSHVLCKPVSLPELFDLIQSLLKSATAGGS